jgi:hypothetical protein
VLPKGDIGSFPEVKSGREVYAVPSYLPVQGTKKSIAIPLYLLRLVQSLSVSTRGTGSFPVVNSARRCYAVPSHLLVPCSRNIRAVFLQPLRLVQSLTTGTNGYRVSPGG